jgi:streptogramin lyase
MLSSIARTARSRAVAGAAFVVFFLAAVASGQGVNEYPIGSAALPEGIALGSDGNLWFAESTGRIGKMTPSGTVTEFSTPTVGSAPQDVTAGPDGNLWFTETSGNRIGRITTAGVITEFPVLTASSGPYGIAAGPDGALWFTESQASRVGRIATDGTVTEFPLPTANSMPHFIASGSDGNLWITEYSTDKIARVTTGGAVTEFPIATANASPEGIAAGADGNLWFVENSGHKIGRISTDGTITEFPLPTPTRAFRICSGPDGNLWFTEFDKNRIGRISTAGVITDFLIPTAVSGPYGITTGPNADLWFTEFDANQLGEIAVADPTLDVSALAPTSGPAGGGTPASLSGVGIPGDATVMVGLRAAGMVSVAGETVSFTTPALPPGTLADIVVTDPATGEYGRISPGWLADFDDVPQSHPFHEFVEKLVRHFVTAGCGAGNYCPSGSVTRAQMAVFLLRAEHGPAYAPPPAQGTVFTDVPADAFAAAWIEAMAAEGITGGCGGGNFCPGNPVRRDQMAVFLLKAEHGSSYTPPACTGVFGDVACPSQFADWIERLAAEAITGGCGGGNYCPANPNTRGQMAVFISKTFGLQ